MTTADRVRKIISTMGAVDAASLTDSAILDELGLDSLDLVEIDRRAYKNLANHNSPSSLYRRR